MCFPISAGRPEWRFFCFFSFSPVRGAAGWRNQSEEAYTVRSTTINCQWPTEDARPLLTANHSVSCARLFD
jgi:hypothetical protein